MLEKIVDKGKWIVNKGKEIGIGKCIILVICGVVLLYLSVGDKGGDITHSKKKESLANNTEQVQAKGDYGSEMEKQLTEILENTEGVGKVKVMITLEGSEEKVVNKDVATSSTKQSQVDNGQIVEQDENQSQPATVLVEGEDGEESPYVIKERNPQIAGVLVIAQGADDQAVVNQITDTVAVLFSVSVHKVRVMRMIVD